MTSLGDEVNREVKDAVQETIIVSRESLNAVTGEEQKDGDGSVEGVTSDQATSTAKTAPSTGRKVKPGDGIIESPIQFHDVSESPEEENGSESTEPEILPEPSVGF